MRGKTGQASSRYLGTLIFLLLLFLNEVFPKAAFASTSLNACARSKECLELIKGSSSSAVSAPTGVGYGVTTLRTTTSSGAIKTFVNGVADFAIVVGPSAAYVSWHFWDEAHNGQAQERAKQKYCTAYPTDVVCRPFTGGQCYDIYYDVYGFVFYPNSPLPNTEQKLGNALLGQINGIVSGIQQNGSALYRLKYTRGNGSVVYQGLLSSSEPNSGVVISRVILAYGNPDVCGNPPPLPWKDWPQAKRDAAVALLNDADWQRLTTSMPVGGTLDPGDSVKAPKIGIPGQEWDNPNTPLDDRRFKSIPEEYSRPIFPDFDHDGDPDETDADDDNDGFLDPYDTAPRNPYVPRASNDPSPPPEDDRTNQSDGERAVSEERQSQGDFLEKPGNEALQNRLDKIEDKYKKAAGMENEAATDPNVGFEQQRLIDEAGAELQQLRNEIGAAWWSSLSTPEQQLFGSPDSGDIDEIRSHMEQWSAATFEQDAQTYEEAVALNILDHSAKKEYTDPLKYLRDASNFDTARAVRTPSNPNEFRREDDTAVWRNLNTGEYIVVDTEGKIRTYGKN